jgi:hypothetical protein
MPQDTASTAQTVRRQAPPKAWKPGQSGNPRGRPPAPVDIAALARVHGPRCIDVAVELLGDADPKVRLATVIALLDRGFGRPMQTISTPDGDSPIALHLLAAKLVSAEIMERMAEREQQQPATIDGHAERGNGEAKPFDFLNAPLPTE